MSAPQRKILVAGCGIAGSITALSLARAGLPVKMLTSASTALDCNSYWAQGGIIYKGTQDASILIDDILTAGAFHNSISAVQHVVSNGPAMIEDWLFHKGKVPFVRTANDWAVTREGGHSEARIVYYGDCTGAAIMKALHVLVEAESNIELCTNTSLVDLHVHQHDDKNTESTCHGVTVWNGKTLETVSTDAVVLATGGIGQLYENTSNPEGSCARGLGIALRAKLKMQDLAYVQFHPTTLFLKETSERFLITEALRGEGGKLQRHDGTLFAMKHHPLGELAPRDIVTRMILAEMKNEGVDNMFLNVSHLEEEYAHERFPTISSHCASLGINFPKDLIPIVPAAHYHCGGIVVHPTTGATSVNGVYAAGEVACTGLHGANRLASTSLLEGLVYGVSVAQAIVTQSSTPSLAGKQYPVTKTTLGGSTVIDTEKVDAFWKRMKGTMWNDVGPNRSTVGLTRAVSDLKALEMEIGHWFKESTVSDETLSLRDASIAARAIATSALETPQSLGTHFIVEDEKDN